jgi:L-asparaginase
MNSVVSRGEVIVVLGTGGTIAGVSTDGDDRHYQAAQLSVEALVAAVPELAGVPLRASQVAQVDSKDMGWPVWRDLLQAINEALVDESVGGVVITHGTDTLEETALLLHLLMRASKPVVLTAAMRPATSNEADGPGNLRDAVAVARWAAAQARRGVVAVMHGRVWAGAEVRKAHAWQVDAFDGGDALPLATIQGGSVRPGERPWPQSLAWAALQGAPVCPDHLPPVALITSHADADGALIDAWCGAVNAPMRGLVVAGTGHGTLHESVEAALVRARSADVVVWRSTRVARGGVQISSDEVWPSTGALTPAQARLALSLALCWRPAQCASWAQVQAPGVLGT